MNKVAIVAIMIALFALMGCQNIEDLGPGNMLAVENQSNLEINVMRHLNNFEKLAKAQSAWNEEDAKIFAEQKSAIVEQMAINYAWLLVIKEAVEANAINPKFFGEMLDRIPGWVGEGKNIYDLIQSMRKTD